MAAIQYITKRLMVEGEKNLQKLSDEGFMGVWRTLTDLAKNPAKADSVHIRFNANHKIQAEDFKGFTGFFRKFAESVKVLWDKWTGHLGGLIEKAKAAAKDMAEKAKAKTDPVTGKPPSATKPEPATPKKSASVTNKPDPVTEKPSPATVIPKKERVPDVRLAKPNQAELKRIVHNLSTQEREAITREAYNWAKTGKLTNSLVPGIIPANRKALKSFWINVLKNNGPGGHLLSDKQIYQFFKLFDEQAKNMRTSCRWGYMSTSKDLDNILTPLGLKSKVLAPGNSVADLIKSGVLKPKVTGSTNIKSLANTLDEPAVVVFNKKGQPIFTPRQVVIRKFEPVKGVNLEPRQEKLLAKLHKESYMSEPNIWLKKLFPLPSEQGQNPVYEAFFTRFLDFAKANPRTFTTEYKKTFGELEKRGFRSYFANKTRAIGGIRDDDHMLGSELYSIFRDPMLLSKMPKTLQASL